MKVLLDSCVWRPAAEALRDAGHDVIWAGDWPTDPGDDEILHRDFHDGRVLVTLDKNFGNLVFVRGQERCGIVRLVRFLARQQGPACCEVLRRYGDELAHGAVLTAEPGRVRIRVANR